MYSEDLVKEVQALVSHQLLSMEVDLLWCGGPSQSRGFAPGREKIQSDHLSQHTAASYDPI